MTTPTSMCTWFAYDPNIAVAGYCTVNSNYYVAIKDEPNTYITKALTRVYGRNMLCSSTYGDSSTSCSQPQAAALGCYWTGSQCTARELSDWTWFSRHTYLEEAPRWMMCPGSPAAALKKCSGINATTCSKTPGCILHEGYCGPAFMQGLSVQQKEAWFTKYRAFDPSVVGSCESACYLKGISRCSTYYSQPGGAQETACKANPFCSWDGTSCRAALYGNDPWGRAVVAAGQTCSGLNKDNKTCLTQGPIGALVQTSRVQQYEDYSPANTAFKCPV